MTCRTIISNGAAGAPAPVSIEDQAQVAAEELPHQIARLKWLAEHNKLHWGAFQIRKRALTAGVATLNRLRHEQAGLALVRSIVASDPAADGYRTLEEYRLALLHRIDAELLDATATVERASEETTHAG